MPRWVNVALSIQVLLAFFFPPLAMGGRLIFVSDLWCVAWVAAGMWDLARRDPTVLRFSRGNVSPLAAFLCGSLLAALLVYAHGYFRVPLTIEHPSDGFQAVFPSYNELKTMETDRFRPGRELIVCLRFVSWLWAGALAATWFSRRGVAGQAADRALASVSRVVTAAVAAAGVILAAERLSPEFAAWLGQVFRFDPSYAYWKGRSYGAFRSPVEAAVAIALGGLCTIMAASRERSDWRRAAFRLTAIIALALATWATGTLAPFVALVLTVGLLAPISPRMRAQRGMIALCASIGLALVFMLSDELRNMAASKLGDLASRARHWSIYVSAATSRLDLVLLGFGFGPYHMDSSYLFLFNRGGLIGLVGVLAAAVTVVARRWRAWPWMLRAIPVYLAIAGLVSDLLVYRHTVMLMIALGIPLLASAVAKPEEFA